MRTDGKGGHPLRPPPLGLSLPTPDSRTRTPDVGGDETAQVSAPPRIGAVHARSGFRRAGSRLDRRQHDTQGRFRPARELRIRWDTPPQHNRPLAAATCPPHATLRVGLAASLAIALLASGCSSSLNRRDEYYLIRELTFQPTPGDGSTIVVGHERDVLRAIADANRAQPRGIDD